jgi:hypothetical protein
MEPQMTEQIPANIHEIMSIIAKAILDAREEETAAVRGSRANDISFGKVASLEKLESDIRTRFNLEVGA